MVIVCFVMEYCEVFCNIKMWDISDWIIIMQLGIAVYLQAGVQRNHGGLALYTYIQQ